MDSLSSLIMLTTVQFLLYAIGWGLVSLLVVEERSAMLHWGMFMLLIGLGFLLSAMRDDRRLPLPYVGSNICFIASFIALSRGLERFFRVRPADRAHAALFGVAALALLLVGSSESAARWRVSVAFGMGALIIGIVVIRMAPRAVAEIGLRLVAAVALPALLLVIFFSARFAQQQLEPGRSFEMHLMSDSNRATLLGYLVGAAMFNFSFMALVTSRLLRHLRSQALRDPLTELPNRRALDDLLQREWARLQRGGQPFALLSLDLDHFKRVNDTYGHLAGDMVLREAGRRLQAAARSSDVVARVGGEEFIVLVPDASAAGALAEAERLRLAVVEQPFALPDSALPVTISAGVALASPGDAGLREVLHRADLALYRAKAEGRNRVVQLDEP